MPRHMLFFLLLLRLLPSRLQYHHHWEACSVYKAPLCIFDCCGLTTGGMVANYADTAMTIFLPPDPSWLLMVLDMATQPALSK